MSNDINAAYLQQINDMVLNAVLYHIGLLSIIDEDPEVKIGPNFTHPIHVVGNGSAHRLVSSLDPPPAPGGHQVVDAVMEYLAHRIIWTETGDERRAMGNADFRAASAPGVTGGQNPMPQWDLEGLIGFMATDIMGSAVYGFQGQISKTINFWNLSRTTYERLKSVEIAAGGVVISEVILNQLLAEVRDTDSDGILHKGMPDMLVLPTLQDQFLSNKTAGYLALPSAGDISGGRGGGVRMFDGCVVFPVGGLTNSIAAAIRRDNWSIINHEAAPGGIHSMAYGPQTDAVSGQTIISKTLFCKEPWKQGKVTGLATTYSA